MIGLFNNGKILVNYTKYRPNSQFSKAFIHNIIRIFWAISNNRQIIIIKQFIQIITKWAINKWTLIIRINIWIYKINFNKWIFSNKLILLIINMKITNNINKHSIHFINNLIWINKHFNNLLIHNLMINNIFNNHLLFNQIKKIKNK